MAMQGFQNTVKSSFFGIAAHFVPIIKQSKFKETGCLSPEEFEAAGDFLVHHCKTWKWESGDASLIKSYLPKEKQFLSTKHVPCHKRISEVDTYDTSSEAIIEAGDGEDGWVDTHHSSSSFDHKVDVEDAMSSLVITDPSSLPANVDLGTEVDENMILNDDGDSDDSEEPIDLDEYVEKGLLTEDNLCVKPSTMKVAPASSLKAKDSANSKNADSSPLDTEIVIAKTRTYDLHITYDRYYQTPRLWISGYTENNQPLSRDQMFEDISEDHKNKTVTMESHPHIPGRVMASVHPCRHAETMKRMAERYSEGQNFGVHMYLLIFLKFMQAVIPTVEYDFTKAIVFSQ